MFYRDQNSMEGYLHICAGKRFKDMPTEIYKHDWRTVMYAWDGKRGDSAGFHMIDVDYCPLCGVKLREEECGAWNEYAQDKKKPVGVS